MYAIHLPRSSLFCEQPSVGTKRGAERCDGKGPGHYEAGFGKGMACVYAIPLKWEWARYVHAVDRSIFSNAFPPWYADRQAPAFPECLQESKAAPNQAGIPTP